MQWLPGFYWKEKEGKRNTFVGASMQSYEVAILLWEELAMPPAFMWQWQILHKALVKASGGEATKALGTIAAQIAYSHYVGALTAHAPEREEMKKLKYIWGPAEGARIGDGKGIGRVPDDPDILMRVDRYTEDGGQVFWYFLLAKGRELIEDGQRNSKEEAVLAAEEAYDSSLLCK
ncbi:hypothetical protein SAMN04488518_11325 [Pseudovibrio ascidiaceicola]|uniref:Uncharacterized protein n=1 Tax=Pseudovibrio ascidiaceicola TaxID=285279 RepID=A0A1I4DWD2_9HYPH|nr:hypothetical protein [Pseudovibrio ascidiaceicola]SFK97902.1 hypothetical protein SAMN04488518_11325 [Pseudovibrio ascidiaceicola]